MRFRRFKPLLFFVLLWSGYSSPCRAADVIENADGAGWAVKSGANLLRLHQEDKSLFLDWLGPISADEVRWQAPLVHAVIEGKVVPPRELLIESVHTERHEDSARVVAKLKHATLPVEIEVTCIGWSDTGVFENEIVLVNKGTAPLVVQQIASLALTLPGAQAQLRYLVGPDPGERRLESVEIGRQGFKISSRLRGRSTRDFSTWWSLFIADTELAYFSQLAYSGNWSARFENNGAAATAIVRMEFDNGGPLRISPGKSFRVPSAVVTVAKGADISAGVNALHRFQRQHVIPHQPANDPLLVQFNTWYALADAIDATNIGNLIPLAADIGCEAFVIDANWYCCSGNRENTNNWEKNLGDWVVNHQTFPDGLTPLIQAVHRHGMKFGLWLEPEVASLNSEVFRDHPNWFLTLDNQPLTRGHRAHLDYSRPEVRERMMSVLDRLMREGKIDWFKFDYNIDIGNRFDQRGNEDGNTRLHDHLMGYYEWLEKVANKYPNVVIENCSSGGQRWDLGIARRTHTSWISDNVNPRHSVQVAYGATIEFAPEICNHWMVGDLKPDQRWRSGSKISTNDPAWWDFMFRIAMNGQFGISSQLDLWSPDAIERAKSNIALYKRIRTTIRGADVYHLTDAPAAGYNPTGWMALEYNQPSTRSCVVLAYRLGNSDQEKQLRLKGLDSNRLYEVLCNGAVAGRRTGNVLSEQGLRVRLPDEWRGAVIEIAATANNAPTAESTSLLISAY